MGLLDRVMAANSRPRAEIEARKQAEVAEEALAKAKAEMFGPKAGDVVGSNIYIGRAKVLASPEDTHIWLVAPNDAREGVLWDFWTPKVNPLDPNNERKTRTYNETLCALSEINNHNGEPYENSVFLGDALRNGKYKGGLVIPPIALVGGRDVEEKYAGIPNLYKLRESGGLTGTFITSRDRSDDAHWYLSCTEYLERTDCVDVVNFIDGRIGVNRKGVNPLNCRPVRLELAL